MAQIPDQASIEEVFNRNLEAVLAERGIDQGGLIELLEEAGYTPETPATILLNDAFAMAAVLGVSPTQLMEPGDQKTVAITPSHTAGGRLLSLWLRAMRPLDGDAIVEFYRSTAHDDMNADLVAENWVWGERLRLAALTVALNDAVDQQDLDEVKSLANLATRILDQEALERADEQVPRMVGRGELDEAVNRAARFRRQAFPTERQDD